MNTTPPTLSRKHSGSSNSSNSRSISRSRSPPCNAKSNPRQNCRSKRSNSNSSNSSPRRTSRSPRTRRNNKDEGNKQSPHLNDDAIEPRPITSQTLASNPLSRISLTFKASTLNISKKTVEQQIPIVLTLKASAGKEVEANLERPGIDVVCVLDTSGSMAGMKMQLLKESLIYIVEALTDKDRLCIVTFVNWAVRKCPLLRMTASNKQSVLRIIDELRASGGTDIIDGLSWGLETLAEKTYKNNLETVFFLSDGLDTNAVKELKNCYKQYQEKLDEKAPSFTLHSFGYGADHDENLMTSIAELRDGSFFFISKFEILKEALATALGGLFSVVASEVSIKVKKVNPTFQNVVSYGTSISYSEEAQEFGVKLTQFFDETSKNFVFLLRVPAFEQHAQIKDTERDQMILEAEVKLTPVEGSSLAQRTLSQKIQIRLFASNQEIEEVEIDNEVLEQYWRVKSLQSWKISEDLMHHGNVKEAQENMLNLQSKLKQLPNYAQSPLLQNIALDTQKIEARLAKGNDNKARKLMKEKGRNRSRERGARDCRNGLQSQMVEDVRRRRGYSVSNSGSDEDA